MKTTLRNLTIIVAVVAACSLHAAFAESLVAPVTSTSSSSYGDQLSGKAIDNDLGTAWNSGRFAPATLVVDLGRSYTLSRIELLTAQHPAGTTEHQIAVSNDFVTWTPAAASRSETTDNQWLSLPIDLPGRYVSVTTTLGPGSVAWREVKVFQQTGTLPEYGFWDEGFNVAKIRTNYDTPAKGTMPDPLTITGCIFADCPHYPPIYSAGNPASHNLTQFSERQYWVLLDNNEPSDNNGCNSGPPNNSLPHSKPGDGIFGFAPFADSVAGETLYRAHLVLNANFPNPCYGGVPYMSIGAHSNRGNVDEAGKPKLLGALNATPGIPHSVSFTTRLYEYQRMRAALYRLVVVAKWPDAQGRSLNRMIQLNLFHDGIDDSSPGGPAKLRWSWPVAEDTFFPGAEVVYFDAEDVNTLCQGHPVKRLTASDRNTDISYDIDLQPLYECAARWGGWSNGMPKTANLPITSVDWAVEGQSDNGALWVAVHDMRMTGAAQSPAIEQVRARLVESCTRNLACAARVASGGL